MTGFGGSDQVGGDAVQPYPGDKQAKGRGQDPDKTTGQERADEVHARNEERQAERDEESLPDKPPIEDMPPEEGHEPPEDDVAEEDADPPEMMPDDEARADDTVDNEERDVSP